MWTREELKIRAKNVLRGCFWSAVVVALITGILTGSFSSSRSNVQNAREINYNEIQSGGESLVDSATQMITGSGHQTENLLARVAGMSFGLVFLGVGISVMLLGLAFGILVGSPIEVGATVSLTNQGRAPAWASFSGLSVRGSSGISSSSCW